MNHLSSILEVVLEKLNHLKCLLKLVQDKLMSVCAYLVTDFSVSITIHDSSNLVCPESNAKISIISLWVTGSSLISHVHSQLAICTEISYMCMWQCYSRSSRLRVAWKSTKELTASKVTTNIKC